MKFAVAILAAVAICHVHAAPTVPSSLYSTLTKEGTADIMVIMRDPVAPLVASVNARRFSTSAAKTTQLVRELRDFTQRKQQQVLSFLSQRTNGQQVKPFWIANRISVRQAPVTLIQDLIHNFGEQIAEIREARVIHLDDVTPEPAPQPKVLEWGYMRHDFSVNIFLYIGSIINLIFIRLKYS